MKTKARLFAPLCLALATSVSANAANYCLAIRGNGELEPAHWGAVANVVERLGLPKMQAGGSSASITMLLTDAIATNSLVNGAAETGSKVQGERAALLLKSMQGLLIEVAKTSQFKEIKTLLDRVEEIKNPQWAQQLAVSLNAAAQVDGAEARAKLEQTKQTIMDGYKTGMKLGLINQRSYQNLYESLERLSRNQDDVSFERDLKVARFYAGELYDALSTFGSFNPETDKNPNLFFRPGIVDFDRLATQFGRIADLYSMQNLAAGEETLWKIFMSRCSKISRDKTWEELLAVEPLCQADFSAIVTAHFAVSAGNFAAQSVGVKIPSFPTTAVLTGNARDQYLKAKVAYEENLDSKFGASFVLNNPEQVRFGYWGADDLLSRIDQNLDRNDAKSGRFLSLGRASWATALGLSPAEPGLSPLKPFTAYGVQMVSAGGWSDLHPVQVLRAAGCESVVYVTRRGGESVFGQGVAQRLLGAGALDALYNLENPRSSFKQALTQADAVLCTDWNRFKITEGASAVSAMIKDGYRSEYVLKTGSKLSGENLPALLNADSNPELNGCH